MKTYLYPEKNGKDSPNFKPKKGTQLGVPTNQVIVHKHYPDHMFSSPCRRNIETYRSC